MEEYTVGLLSNARFASDWSIRMGTCHEPVKFQNLIEFAVFTPQGRQCTRMMVQFGTMDPLSSLMPILVLISEPGWYRSPRSPKFGQNCGFWQFFAKATVYTNQRQIWHGGEEYTKTGGSMGSHKIKNLGILAGRPASFGATQRCL